MRIKYSKAKNIPVDFLTKLGLSEVHYQGNKAVRIPYFDSSQKEVAANFRVRLIDVSSSTARDFYLDALAVRVTYR